MDVRPAILAAALLLVSTGCGSHARAEPLGRTRLYVDADGRTMHTTVNCGGTLRAKETATEVVITYIEPYIAPGAATCALVRIAATLKQPIQGRIVTDGISHDPVDIFDLTALDRPDPGQATPMGPPTWSVGLACPGTGTGFVVETPCGARDYHIPGQSGPVTLVEDLAGDPMPWHPQPTPESPPWCLQLSGSEQPYCRSITCHHVANAVPLVACDAPNTRYSSYLTWQLGANRLYLTSSEPADLDLLARLATSISDTAHQG